MFPLHKSYEIVTTSDDPVLAVIVSVAWLVVLVVWIVAIVPMHKKDFPELRDELERDDEESERSL